MIYPSNDYLNAFNSLSISPKTKIVVDETEYSGNIIKTSPKISHAAIKIAGSFPMKTATFEMFNLNNDIDFVGKELIIYKGIYVNGEIEYIPQGVFIPKEQNVQTNISKRTITFNNVQDKTQFLDDKYESSLDWTNNQTHTGLEIVQEICTRKNIILANNDFGFANYRFKEPNFVESITNRQVIASLAEIGGETAFFNDYGQLTIKKPTVTNQVINRNRYSKISAENQITINTVVLGKKDVDDDCIYPEQIVGERVELRIEDNPFVDLVREEIIEEVAENIIGLSFVPYQLNDFIDGFIFELNDVITVLDRNGNRIPAIVMDIQSNNRLRSNYKLQFNLLNGTNYTLAGGNRETFRKVRQEVDHINQEIRSIIEEQDDTSERITSITTSIDGIETNISNTQEQVRDLEETVKVYNIALDLYNITIPVDNNHYPIENSTFIVNATSTFKGNVVQSSISTQSTHTGIGCSISGNEITFSVQHSTAITSLKNEYVIDFLYMDGSDAYSLSCKIILTLALQGVQGEQGQAGQNGTNGTNAYVHIRYSKNSNGNPMVVSPTSETQYIGIANTTSSTAPSSYTSYTWSKIKGEQGEQGEQGIQGIQGEQGIQGIQGEKGEKGDTGNDGKGISTLNYYYKATNSQTAPSASSVTSTSIPTLDATTNKYLWQKEVITYTDSTSKTTVALIGVYGNTGEQGQSGTSVTISGTEVRYQTSSSGTTTPTGTWQTDVPSVSSGQYLWTRTIVNYSPSGSTTSYSVSYKGIDGQDGAKGDKGDKGETGETGSAGVSVTSMVEKYYLSTSNTSQSGGSWNTTIPSYVSGRYYWKKTTTTYSDGTSKDSTAVLDNALTSANSTALSANNTASTANSNASTALSTANTANTNANEALNKANFIGESIVGTQNANTRFWTGVSTLTELVDGQQILYWNPRSTAYTNAGDKVTGVDMRVNASTTKTAGTTIISFETGTSTNVVWLNLTLANGTETGWIPCYYGGTVRLTSHYDGGKNLHFTYKENANIAGVLYTGWFADGNYFSDTYDNRINNFASKTGAVGIWSNSLFMEDGNGTYQNICTASDGTCTSSNRTTATTKIANTNGFKVGSTIYFTNTNYNANTNINGGSVIYSSKGSLFDSRYSFNTTLTAGSLTAYKPIYLQGDIHDDDGLFYLDSTWWTQTPNQSGKIYILVGSCYDSTTSNCRITLNENNPWYICTDNGTLQDLNKQKTDNATNIALGAQTIATDVGNDLSDLQDNLQDNYYTKDDIDSQTSEITTNVVTITKKLDKHEDDIESVMNFKTSVEVNGVTKVDTQTGFKFDSSGLLIDKTTGKTTNLLDDSKMLITEKSSGEEMLFAGYDENINRSVVRTRDLEVDNYFVAGSHLRIEKYTDSTDDDSVGFFYV